MTSSGGRVYGGQSEDERRNERRDRLLAAGLELFGALGWDSTSIDRLCTEAGVSTRYFYEEFRSREELLEAVYEAACRRSVQVVLDVLSAPGEPVDRLTACVRAYVLHVTEDPGRIRLLHHDARRVPGLEALRVRFMGMAWNQFPTAWAAGGGRSEVTALAPEHLLRARAVGGAMTEALTHWLNAPEPRPDRERLADLVATSLVPVVLAPSGAPKAA